MRFDPNIFRHSGIWGAADKSVLNNIHNKKTPFNLGRPLFLFRVLRNKFRPAGHTDCVLYRSDVNTSITCSASNNNLSTPLQTTSYINIKCKSSFLKELKHLCVMDILTALPFGRDELYWKLYLTLLIRKTKPSFIILLYNAILHK